MTHREKVIGGNAAWVVALLAVFALLWLLRAPPKPPIIQQIPVPAVPQDVPEQQFQGWVPDEEGTQQFLKELGPRAEIFRAGPQLRVRENEPVYLYRALYKAYEEYRPGQKWIVGKQGIGDCVSWGFAHAADIHLAVMYLFGDTSRWEPAATESIYGGSRVEARGRTTGGYADGSYGAAAAKWLINWGAVFRQAYKTPNGILDLTKYDANRAKDWGNYGNGGRNDSGWLDNVAKKHPIKDTSQVKTFREAASAIQSGYPVAVCSGQGFARTRDEHGFARPSGSWAHCMVFIAVRFDRPGLLCLNSWGPKWISGPKYPPDMPDGSFWVDATVATSMLGRGDSFAVSGYQGFPFRVIDHSKWVLDLRYVDSELYALAP